VQWVADWGGKTRCCQTATDEDLQGLDASEVSRLYDCLTCEGRQRREDLWPTNSEAWDVWRGLCRRVLGDTQAHAWYLARMTEGWSVTEVSRLLEQLDLIASILSPKEDSRSDG
jgi:uncharacterized CHY-type Zn-finger protein